MGFAILLVILANVFWYSAKFFIRSNGLKADMFWRHFRDFSSLRKLMSDKYSKETNNKAKFYLLVIPVTVISAFAVLITAAGNNV